MGVVPFAATFSAVANRRASPVCGAPRELFEPQVEIRRPRASRQEPMAMFGLR